MDKDVLDRILGPRVIRWRMMNEDGNGIEARKEIGRYFALSLDGRSFEDAYKELQRANTNGCTTTSTQGFIDRTMVSTLRYEWGDEVANMVKGCIIV